MYQCHTALIANVVTCARSTLRVYQSPRVSTTDTIQVTQVNLLVPHVTTRTHVHGHGLLELVHQLSRPFWSLTIIPVIVPHPSLSLGYNDTSSGLLLKWTRI